MSEEIQAQLGRIRLLLTTLTLEGLSALDDTMTNNFFQILQDVPSILPDVIRNLDKTLRIIDLTKHFSLKYPDVNTNIPEQLQEIPLRDRKVIFTMLKEAVSMPMQLVQLLIDAKYTHDMGLH